MRLGTVLILAVLAVGGLAALAFFSRKGSDKEEGAEFKTPAGTTVKLFRTKSRLG